MDALIFDYHYIVEGLDYLLVPMWYHFFFRKYQLIWGSSGFHDTVSGYQELWDIMILFFRIWGGGTIWFFEDYEKINRTSTLVVSQVYPGDRNLPAWEDLEEQTSAEDTTVIHNMGTNNS